MQPDRRKPAAPKVTPAMLACLKDAGRGPLIRTVAGWGLEGGARWHAGNTVDALVGRGLLTVVHRNSVRTRKGRATITPVGADALVFA